MIPLPLSVLDVVKDLLSMCDVVKASIFDEGKEHLESQKFDLAILDIMGVDGYGMLKIGYGGCEPI
jgi:DNA-binding response OmpR family regulator